MTILRLVVTVALSALVMTLATPVEAQLSEGDLRIWMDADVFSVSE